MMQIVKKSYFTLLELLIVLLIISFGIILTGVKIKEVYREQRFLSEAHQILNHLAMAQDLMLILDTDVQVKIALDKEKEQLNVWLEIEKPIEKPRARLIERKLSLAAIQSFEFVEFEGGSYAKDLTLQFSLGRMSKGTLTLFEEGEGKKHHSKQGEFKIELLGYPSPIGVARNPLEERKKSERSELLYPIEVYEKLYADNEKNQEAKP